MRADPAQPSATADGALLVSLALESFRLNSQLLAVGDRMSADLGLSAARWQVLATLAGMGAPATVSAIARRMGLRRQSVQRHADALAADGLVEYRDNPADRRARLVAPSPAARAPLDTLRQRQLRWAGELARELEAWELEAALRVVARLREKLEAGAG